MQLNAFPKDTQLSSALFLSIIIPFSFLALHFYCPLLQKKGKKERKRDEFFHSFYAPLHFFVFFSSVYFILFWPFSFYLLYWEQQQLAGSCLLVLILCFFLPSTLYLSACSFPFLLIYLASALYHQLKLSSPRFLLLPGAHLKRIGCTREALIASQRDIRGNFFTTLSPQSRQMVVSFLIYSFFVNDWKFGICEF